MANENRGLNTWLWTLGAIAALTWAIIAVVVAALGPSEYVPRIFSSYHLEHFVAFYVLAILAAMALPRVRVIQIALVLAVLATVLAGLRMFIPRHQLATAEDLGADIGGIAAALAPMLIAHFRQIAARNVDPPAQ
jgi:hypothetical protein